MNDRSDEIHHVCGSSSEDLPQDVMEGYVDPPSEPDNPDTESSDSDIKPYARRCSPVKMKLGLASHIVVNEGEPPTYTCTVCKCRFVDKKTSKYHDYCALGKRPFKCRLCGKRYVKQSYLDQHTKTHTGEKPYQCTFCDKAFHIKHKLNRHERTHTGKKGHIKCLKCNQTFITKEALTKHEVRKHSSETPFTCKKCKETFAEEAVYLAHIETHSVTKIHICEYCGKKFKKSWNLTVHKRIHVGQKPYECGICKVTFRIRQHLERHCLRHQPDPDFECILCKATFRRKDNLLRHLKWNHPGRHVGVWTKEDLEAARKNVLWRKKKEATSSSAGSELLTRFPNIRFAKKRAGESNNLTENNPSGTDEISETNEPAESVCRGSVIKFIKST